MSCSFSVRSTTFRSETIGSTLSERRDAWCVVTVWSPLLDDVPVRVVLDRSDQRVPVI